MDPQPEGEREMTRGDMEENVSGCFFLNTVYITVHLAVNVLIVLFLADRRPTNGCAIVTVFRQSVCPSVCLCRI